MRQGNWKARNLPCGRFRNLLSPGEACAPVTRGSRIKDRPDGIKVKDELEKFFAGLAFRLSSHKASRLRPERAAPIESAISPLRLSSYGRGAPQGTGLTLYLWNADISGAFLFPLHICEVVTRIAVANALANAYGPDWPWEKGFVYSLRKSRGGYSPRSDLMNAARKAQAASQVMPELKFAFWRNMFTQSFENGIWSRNLPVVIPDIPSGAPVPAMRERIYGLLKDIRLLRNRIAHHEPIINRNLLDGYGKIMTMIGCISPETAEWVADNQIVTACIACRPG